MKRLLTYFLILFITIGIVGCNNSNTKENESTTLDKDELIVGLDDTFAPMGFKDSSGKLVGFDVDLASELSKIINKKIKFQPIDWSMKETELNAKNIDLIWNGYSITEERKEKILYSEPYIDNEQIIVVLKDSSIKSKEDLIGKNVATQKDSSTEDAFENDSTGVVAKFKNGAATLYPTFTDVFTDLDTKRSDAIVGDSILVRYIIKQKGEDKYRILDDNFGSEQMGIGMRKEDTLLKEKIDNALNELKDNGTYDRIFKKWFD